MQLGKTTIFSLALELFSHNKIAPDYRLEYMIDEKERNKWFERISSYFLVDGYDQPVREALLRFAPSHSSGLYVRPKQSSRQCLSATFPSSELSNLS
jgi:hypothetical protein